MLDAVDPFDWLEGVLNEAVRSIFGEPGETPEHQVMEIEEAGIAITGHNINGLEVPA